jgi:hypothetical protein
MFNITNTTSLSELGYNAAATGDTLKTIADELRRRYPQGLTEEAKAELKAGMYGRKHELVGERRYLVEGRTYTPIGPKDKVKADAVTFTLTVDYAVSLTAYEFGKLKTENPELYKIVAELRTDANKYASNRLTDLMKHYNKKASNTRAPNKAYAEWISGDKGIVQTMLTRLANAIKNGDETAPRSKAELIQMLTNEINKAK